MSNPAYAAVIYIEDSSNFQLDRAVEVLKQHGHAALNDRNEVDLTFDGFQFKLVVEEGTEAIQVIKDSFSETDSGDPLAERAKNCRRRLFLWSCDRDPDMDHFNDYIITLEILLKSFTGLIAQDDASGEWI